jgi:hypothetical protein
MRDATSDEGQTPIFEYSTATGFEIAHIDHVVPEWMNGPTSPANSVIACAPCNLAKSGRHVGDPRFIDWLHMRRRQVFEEEIAYARTLAARAVHNAARYAAIAFP